MICIVLRINVRLVPVVSLLLKDSREIKLKMKISALKIEQMI